MIQDRGPDYRDLLARSTEDGDSWLLACLPSAVVDSFEIVLHDPAELESVLGPRITIVGLKEDLSIEEARRLSAELSVVVAGASRLCREET